MTYIQNVNIESIGLNVNKEYYLYAVSDSFAMTFKMHIKIKEIKPVASYAQYNNLIQVIFIEKGKRKEKCMFLKSSMLFLESDIPLMVDTDLSSFKGNALINFITSCPEELKSFILENNKFKYSNLGIITYTSEEQPLNAYVLFPEHADINHAVVRKIIAGE